MMFASKILLIRRNDPTQFAVFSAGPVADSSAFWKRKTRGCSKTVLQKEGTETTDEQSPQTVDKPAFGSSQKRVYCTYVGKNGEETQKRL